MTQSTPNKKTLVFKNRKGTPATGFFFFIAFLLLLGGCQYLKQKISGIDEKPIARVYDEYLYASDLKNLTTGLSPKDSAQVIKSAIEKWMQQQLLLKKAVENIPDNDPSILRKVEDYRQSLVLYEYEKALIIDRLDTAINQADIQKYYDQYNDNFPLSQIMYLIQFVKLKDNAPEIKEFKKLLLKNHTTEDEEQIEGYCKANVTSYAFAEPLWYNAENLKTMFRFEDGDLLQLSVNNKFKAYEKEEGTTFYVRILDIKREGEKMPIELARTDIAKIIIEKRKMKLIEDFYKRAYNEGVTSKNAELYVQ